MKETVSGLRSALALAQITSSPRLTQRHSSFSTGAFLTIIGAMGVVYWASIVLIPVVAALFLFFLLDPIVDGLQQNARVPRVVSVPALILVVMLCFGLLGWGAGASFSQALKQAPLYAKRIQALTQALDGKAEDFRKQTQWLMSEGDSSGNSSDKVARVTVVDGDKNKWMSFFLRGLGSISGALMTAFAIPILTLFFLLEKGLFRRAIVGVGGVKGTYEDLSRMTRGFFWGSFIVGLGTSCGFYIIFKAIGLDHSMSLALLAGFINLIPIIGSVLGVVFPLAQSLIQFEGYGNALLIVCAFFGIHLIVGNVVIPKLVGQRVNVNSSSAMVGLLLWGWLWGIPGILLAIPLTAMIRIFLSSRQETRAWAKFIEEH